jgi:hypothetical protein
MSKTDTPNDHRPLADSELDAVTGGLVVNAIIMPLIALDIGRPPRKRCRDGGLERPAKAERILRHIMSKTNDTYRELTSNELDAVSGGLGPDNLQKKNATNPPVWGPAIDAWNKLLHQYGYA